MTAPTMSMLILSVTTFPVTFYENYAILSITMRPTAYGGKLRVVPYISEEMNILWFKLPSQYNTGNKKNERISTFTYT